jgi:tryptophan halogenase
MDLAGTFSTTFTDENYRFILYGMQHYPQLQQLQAAPQHQALFQHAQQLAKHAKLSTLPHLKYLQGLQGTAAANHKK